MSARLLKILLVASLATAPVSAAWPQTSPGGPAVRSGAAQASEAAPAIGAEDQAILIGMLRSAPAQGFAADAFKVDEIERQLGSTDAGQQQAGQAALTAAAIAYAKDQHGGLLPTSKFRHEWAIHPAPYDARADFAGALAGHRLAAWTASLPPPDVRYARLVSAYARYQDIAAHGGWEALPAKPKLKPGVTGDAVEALRRRLAVEDPATPPAPPVPLPAPPGAQPAPPAPPVYDEALKAAVARAQARYGLTPDGVVGASTLAALNVPVGQRLGQIRANLERWRWTPRVMPAYRVELNIADPGLALYDAGKPALTMRAIVGRAVKRTPSFLDHIEAVVLNPPWNVPPEIAAKEVWPKIRRIPGYMAREGFVVRPGGGLQQKPGPKCALGYIKFDLSNPFGVYLHDTPSRKLFARDSRALSHGCMRLEKPSALAERVLRDDPAWGETRIEMALMSKKTVRIPLKHPVPLFVVYSTAFVDDHGQTQFRQDIYGWDVALLDLL